MAISRLLVLESRKEDRLELSLYQAFDAKVNAEITQGVGYNWDAEILVSHRAAINVPRGIQGVIESAYDKFPLTPIFFDRKGYAKEVDLGLRRDWAERLSRFAKSVLVTAEKSKRRPKSNPQRSRAARKMSPRTG